MRNYIRFGKIVLLLVACILFSFSVYYTNTIVKRIKNEERQKAVLWAYAIRKKASLIRYTEELFAKIEQDERRKGELWANGVKRLVNIEDPNTDLSFLFEVVQNNQTVPVILTDEHGQIISTRNLDPNRVNDPRYLENQKKLMTRLHPPIEIKIQNKTRNYLYYKESKIFSELRLVLNDLIRTFITEEIIGAATIPVIYTDETQKRVIEYGNMELKKGISELATILEEMKLEHDPIRIDLPNGAVNYIFYKDSSLLNQLKFYPYVQVIAILVFFFLAYMVFNTSRLSEQNRVWVGMSKETAHQLGTPISSLMAWLELLKVKYPGEQAVPEMENDISRLTKITDRFSKIGSQPQMNEANLMEVLIESIEYLKRRVSKKVVFHTEDLRSDVAIPVMMNQPLIEWAIENITKNAVDAMVGDGSIYYRILLENKNAIIEISDTGKGIPSNHFNKVFKPGYSTKKRGWGLGLALVRRIIEDYHRGKIYVKKSEVNVGTTFRIVLRII